MQIGMVNQILTTDYCEKREFWYSCSKCSMNPPTNSTYGPLSFVHLENAITIPTTARTPIQKEGIMAKFKALTGICLEELRTTTKTSQPQSLDLNLGLHEHKSGALTTRSQCPVFLILFYTIKMYYVKSFGI
jgi:hypothetical protein